MCCEKNLEIIKKKKMFFMMRKVNNTFGRRKEKNVCPEAFHC